MSADGGGVANARGLAPSVPLRWMLGAVSITRIEEQIGPGAFPPDKFYSNFDREAFRRHLDWLVPRHYSPEQDRLITSIHSWLVRTPRHTILVDACAGNDKERPWNPRFHHLQTPFLERLRAAGAAPEDIDIVLCTHLHADHVGWNTQLRDGRWVPTFPNARYLFSRIENDYWDPRGERLRNDPGRRGAYEDSVLPVVESGQALLLDGDHQIDDSLLVEPAPGHTPGHVMLKLQAGRGGCDGRGTFCGDVIHHPVQCHEPHWNSSFCEDPAQAAVTRRRLLEHCVETGAWLFPTHFGPPHVARILPRGDAFAPEFIEGREAG
jgi:glyoxylase-like metal-dependent hydrolase (beta-lactamase superfamily II)